MRQIWSHIPPPIRAAIGIMAAVQVALSVGFVLYVEGAPGTRQFNMDSELNLPTWWSSVLLITAGSAAMLLSRVNKYLGRPTVAWLVVGLGLLALSAEEIAGIHEDVGVWVGGGTENVSVWPLVYAPFAIAGAYFMIRALRDLPRPLALVGLAGLALYGAVLAMEVLALSYESNVTILLEENLEMAGTGLMFVAVSSELYTRAASLFTRIVPAEEAGVTAAGGATP